MSPLVSYKQKVVKSQSVQGYYPNKRFDKNELIRCLLESGFTQDLFVFEPMGHYTTILTIKAHEKEHCLVIAEWMYKAGIVKVKVTHRTTSYDEYLYQPIQVEKPKQPEITFDAMPAKQPATRKPKKEVPRE